MGKAKITIHRALSELKIIDSRIEKSIQSLEPSGASQEGKLVNGFYEKEKFNENAKANYQSVLALIERKNTIKSAITKANGSTMVKVGDKEMTISDAINYKTVIGFRKLLIDQLVRKHNQVKAKVSQNNDIVDSNALKLAESALQKDNVKISDGDAVAITEPYIQKNKFHLIDPLEVEKLVSKLQEEVDEFEAEVDAVLSEINAITTIEV